MSKPEWGEKRECPKCGSRFYDLKRDPVICPKCETPYLVTTEKAPVTLCPRIRQGKASSWRPARARKASFRGREAKKDLREIDIDDDADDEDDGLIENAAELVKGDDVSDVLDGAVDGSKTDE